ncbi:TetR/AcrR family transcriptional regulator [Chitiniphilus shinanonensis]|uniref:TetR/AcrR family transcriptional regulator n=1 Tax=Chitiniphilus shinanonensis TaxID=553088 RepID=UPI003051D251
MTAAPPPRTRGRPAGAADQDVRARLLDAALARFAAHGIAATSMAQVAKHAGVTPAMVHYYFDNRDRLLDALVDERVAPLIEHVWAASDDEAADPRLLLQGVIARMTAGVASRPWLPPLWIGEILNESGLLRGRLFARLPLPRLRGLTQALAALQAQGALHPDIEPRLVFVSVLGLAMLPFAVAGQQRHLPDGTPLAADVVARHASALLLHGLGQPVPTRKPA